MINSPEWGGGSSPVKTEPLQIVLLLLLFVSVAGWWIVVRRGDIIWLPSRKSMVTPVVCPRLFGILTMLTFRALRRNHIVSTAFETIAKKKKRQHNRSWKRNASNVGVGALAVSW